MVRILVIEQEARIRALLQYRLGAAAKVKWVSTFSSALEKLERHKVPVWLVNTGWTRGPYGVGERMKLAHTRAMLKAALAASSSARDFPPRSADDLYILYTGGTTGASKGVSFTPGLELKLGL